MSGSSQYTQIRDPQAEQVQAIEIGLDFGTGNIRFAYRLQKQNGSVTPTRIGHLDGRPANIPACVAYHDGKLYYGEGLLARVRQEREPSIPAENVISCYKMLLYDKIEEDKNPADVLKRARAKLDAMGKTVDELLTDHLAALYTDIKDYVCKQYTEYDDDSLQDKPLRVRMACPQLWSPRARQRMASASQYTHLVQYTNLASEPQAMLAAHLDAAESSNTSVRYVAGDYILVIDMGCGTIDFVLYRLTDDLHTKSRLEIIDQSAGSACGSYVVDEYIVQYIADEYPPLSGRHQTLDMDDKEFKWHLLQKAQDVKEHFHGYEGWMTIGILQDPKHRFDGNVPVKVLREAHTRPLEEIKDIVDKFRKDRDIKLAMIGGGFRRSTYMMGELKRCLTNVRGIKIDTCRDYKDTDDTLVAEGLFSDRYPPTQQQKLPPVFSYAVLQDEILDPYNEGDHDDCYSVYTRLPLTNKTRLDPFDKKTPIVIDRLRILIKNNEEVNPVPLDMFYRVPCNKPVMSARLVYMEGRHYDHGPALVDSHDAKKNDNALRKGVYDWAQVKAKLDKEELLRRGAQPVQHKDGPYIELNATIECNYENEEKITWKWTLKLPGGDLAIDGMQIWDANASMLTQEHENLEVEAADEEEYVEEESETGVEEVAVDDSKDKDYESGDVEMQDQDDSRASQGVRRAPMRNARR